MNGMLQALAANLEEVASGKNAHANALRAAQALPGLEQKFRFTLARWATGCAGWRDVNGLRRVARRIREMDPEHGEGVMVVKERFGVQLKNGSFVMDEESNSPLVRSTKRALYLMFGDDANVQPMRCTYEVIVRAKRPAQPKTRRKAK